MSLGWARLPYTQILLFPSAFSTLLSQTLCCKCATLVRKGFYYSFPPPKQQGWNKRESFLISVNSFFSSGFPSSHTELLLRLKHLHTIKVSASRIKRILSYFASLPAPCARLSRLPAPDIIISAKRKYQTLEKCCTPRNSRSLVSQPAFCFYKHRRSCTQLLRPVPGWACDDFPKPHGCSYISIQALEYFQQFQPKREGLWYH